MPDPKPFIVQTNSNKDSVKDLTGSLMPAKAFFFVIVEEIGQNGFVTRKIYTSPNSPYLQKLNLSPLQIASELHPEKYGLSPKNAASNIGIARHVLGANQSSMISASSIFPQGSPRLDGKNIHIDIKASGAKLISTQEIQAALEAYKIKHPHLTGRISVISNFVKTDMEILLKPTSPFIKASAIYTDKSLAFTQNVIKGARVVQVVGVVFTAYDLGIAANQSIKESSVKPISAQVIRTAGSWGAAWAGAKIGAAGGAAVGITTGPGAIVTGLIGGIVFGTAGYFGADWVADHIYEN